MPITAERSEPSVREGPDAFPVEKMPQGRDVPVLHLVPEEVGIAAQLFGELRPLPVLGVGADVGSRRMLPSKFR